MAFFGQTTDLSRYLWLAQALEHYIDMYAVSLCDHVEDGCLFAGYCCLSCPSPLVSVIGFVRLALSCYSLGRQRRRTLGVDAQLRDLPHHLN